MAACVRWVRRLTGKLVLALAVVIIALFAIPIAILSLPIILVWTVADRLLRLLEG